MADVLLIGMGPTSYTALESLISTVKVVGLVRKPDASSEAVDPVIFRAQGAGVPVYPDISMAAIDRLVQDLKPNCVVISSYNRILKPQLLQRCRFINVHYAPLPQYRGRANVNWALINDEPCAGITMHTVSPGLDDGNILFQRVVAIGGNDTVADLYEKLNEIQRHHLGKTVIRYLDGYEGVPQSHRDASYGCTRIPSDGEINWEGSTRDAHRLVRALVRPFPGAYTFFGGKRLTVWKAEPIQNPPNFRGRVPGRVIGLSKSDGYVDVLTGDGILRIFEVQVQGQGTSVASDVIKSTQETLGFRPFELLERIDILERQVSTLMERKASEQAR